MPILATSVVMDTEDFLHPEGPQLESPKFSVSSPPHPNAIEVAYSPYTSSPHCISFHFWPKPGSGVRLSVGCQAQTGAKGLSKAFQDTGPCYIVALDNIKHTLFLTLFSFQEVGAFTVWLFAGPSALGS